MSLLVRTVDSSVSRLLYVYDAPESWVVGSGDPASDPFLPRVETNDRSGCWFAAGWERDRWGATLLRDDAPFNDCLPPTGWALEQAWKETEGARDLIRVLQSAAEETFLNPFDAYAGTWTSGEVCKLEQGFQSRTDRRETDSLAVANHPKHDPSAVMDEAGERLLPRDRLRVLARQPVDDGGLYHEDARLPTRATVIVETNPDRRTVEVVTGYPEPESTDEVVSNREPTAFRGGSG